MTTRSASTANWDSSTAPLRSTRAGRGGGATTARSPEFLALSPSHRNLRLDAGGVRSGRAGREIVGVALGGGPRRRRLSKSVAKAPIPPKRRRRIVDIPRFLSPPIPVRSAFATDLDNRPPRAAPGAPPAPPLRRSPAPSRRGAPIFASAQVSSRTRRREARVRLETCALAEMLAEDRRCSRRSSGTRGRPAAPSHPQGARFPPVPARAGGRRRARGPDPVPAST